MFVNWERISLLADPNDPDDQIWLADTMKNLALDLDEKIAQALRLAQENNIEELKANLHQMKGVAANFGFELLAKQASEAEDYFRNSHFEKGKELVSQLKTTWENTRQELKTKFSVE